MLKNNLKLQSESESVEVHQLWLRLQPKLIYRHRLRFQPKLPTPTPQHWLPRTTAFSAHRKAVKPADCSSWRRRWLKRRQAEAGAGAGHRRGDRGARLGGVYSLGSPAVVATIWPRYRGHDHYGPTAAYLGSRDFQQRRRKWQHSRQARQKVANNANIANNHFGFRKSCMQKVWWLRKVKHVAVVPAPLTKWVTRAIFRSR